MGRRESEREGGRKRRKVRGKEEGKRQRDEREKITRK